jgi:hypothetical protein
MFFTIAIGAESISEQLKVADCNFQIKYEKKDVQVLDQKITLRAVADRKESATSDSVKVVTAAGYRAYHLEIAYIGRHIAEPHALRKAEFYNNKDKMIHVADLGESSRTMVESDRNQNLDVRYLSINLENIPLVLLDDVVIIELRQ